MNIREKWNNYYKSSCLKRLGSIDKEKTLILEKNDEVYNHKLNQYDAIILLEPLNQTFDILSYLSKRHVRNIIHACAWLCCAMPSSVTLRLAV